MELLNFILILAAMITFRKWYLAKVELRSIRADLHDANRKLKNSSTKSCSHYLTHTDLERVFGDCTKV